MTFLLAFAAPTNLQPVVGAVSHILEVEPVERFRSPNAELQKMGTLKELLESRDDIVNMRDDSILEDTPYPQDQPMQITDDSLPEAEHRDV